MAEYIPTLFTDRMIKQIEDLLKQGKVIEIQYIKPKDELKIGLKNYHRIKVRKY